MTTQATINWPQLYEQDEVAWLDAMAAYAASGQADKLDLVSLQDYLESGAERTRVEVKFKLKEVIVHHLRWEAQPELRTREWLGQMFLVKRELREYFKQPTLATYGTLILRESYELALEELAILLGPKKFSSPMVSEHSASEWVSLDLPKYSEEAVHPLASALA
jgi:hypothetical protein